MITISDKSKYKPMYDPAAYKLYVKDQKDIYALFEGKNDDVSRSEMKKMLIKIHTAFWL
jgi:hypothetical protein